MEVYSYVVFFSGLSSDIYMYLDFQKKGRNTTSLEISVKNKTFEKEILTRVSRLTWEGRWNQITLKQSGHPLSKRQSGESGMETSN